MCKLQGSNDTTGDFRARVPGWLRGEIIRSRVDDQRMAYDFLQRETIGQESGECISITAEERRQVTGMVGMRAVVGIVMHHNVSEGVFFISGTAHTFMDVETKNRRLAEVVGNGKPCNFCCNDDSIGGLIESNPSADGFMVRTTSDDSCGMGLVVESGGKLDIGISKHEDLPENIKRVTIRL